MILAVTDVQKVLILPEHVTHALRVMKLSLIVCTIDKTNLSVANLVLEFHRILIDEHNSIICSIRDDKQIPVQARLLLHADNLAWVPEVLPSRRSLFTSLTYSLIDALGFDLVGLLLFRLPADRRAVVQLLVVKVVGDRKEQVKYLSMALAG